MGGDGWRVGASFLHRIRRLFTLTLKPRVGYRIKPIQRNVGRERDGPGAGRQSAESPL